MPAENFDSIQKHEGIQKVKSLGLVPTSGSYATLTSTSVEARDNQMLFMIEGKEYLLKPMTFPFTSYLVEPTETEKPNSTFDVTIQCKCAIEFLHFARKLQKVHS